MSLFHHSLDSSKICERTKNLHRLTLVLYDRHLTMCYFHKHILCSGAIASQFTMHTILDFVYPLEYLLKALHLHITKYFRWQHLQCLNIPLQINSLIYKPNRVGESLHLRLTPIVLSKKSYISLPISTQ